MVFLTVKKFKSVRSNEALTFFFARVEVDGKSRGTDKATLARKRKAPARFEVGTGVGHHHESVVELYCCLYFEAISLAMSGLKDRFNQPA